MFHLGNEALSHYNTSLFVAHGGYQFRGFTFSVVYNLKQ
jgi:hypothetical protein